MLEVTLDLSTENKMCTVVSRWTVSRTCIGTPCRKTTGGKTINNTTSHLLWANQWLSNAIVESPNFSAIKSKWKWYIWLAILNCLANNVSFQKVKDPLHSKFQNDSMLILIWKFCHFLTKIWMKQLNASMLWNIACQKLFYISFQTLMVYLAQFH